MTDIIKQLRELARNMADGVAGMAPQDHFAWEAAAEIERLQAAQVPDEAVDAMIKAALAGYCDEEPNLPCGHDIGDDGARAIWRVMVKAARKP